MTWSIVARDRASGKFAIAIATKFFAVGALCPYARAGVGAIASQALPNPLYGSRGLRLMAEGVPAPVVAELLVADDEGRAARQFHLIDSHGRNAVHTGSDCVDWVGHQLGLYRGDAPGSTEKETGSRRKDMGATTAEVAG